MMMPESVVATMADMEKRKFERHSFGIRACVQSGADKTPGRQEMVLLCDLSGEGALFTTAFVDWYAAGLPVSLTICMPGAPGVRAVMQTSGVVIRVMTAPADKGAMPGEARVALHFTKPLQFQRNGGGAVGAACDELVKRRSGDA